MMTLSLTLRPTAGPQHRPAAVVLPGADPHQWIRDLLQAEWPLSDVRFLLLSTGNSTSGVQGALCPGSEAQLAKLPARLPRYGCVGDRFYVPLDAGFSCPVAHSEWDRLLPDSDCLLVGHPTLGLLQYDPEHVVTAVSLFRLPPLADGNWSRALPGHPTDPGLISLAADLSAATTALQQDDIGTQTSGLGQLPAVSGEPPVLDVRTVVSSPLRPFAALVKWLHSRSEAAAQAADPQTAGGGGKSGGFLEGLSNWLQQVSQIAPGLQRERERQIHRLLERLKTNPDEGLRYALPLTGGVGQRLSAATAQLTRRIVDFGFAGGGGGATDNWDLNYELQMRLTEQYRQAAQREIRLGRYRRAAYVYAELLGDLHQAATALEEGGHFHEAAAVYRDRLNKPEQAAQCLERAGLLYDAIEIYEQLDRFENVGELYERLDEAEKARQAFRQAVDARLAVGDRLKAASLLRSRLDAADEALDVLWAGAESRRGQWQACLREFFEGCGQLGDHRRASVAVEHLRTVRCRSTRSEELVAALADQATRYPEAAIGHQAAEAVRSRSAALFARTGTAAPKVLQALARLAPQDRLLARDCSRFQMPQKQPVEHVRRQAGLQLVREIRLPQSLTWLAAESLGNAVYLLGHDGDETLECWRIDWCGDEAQQSHVRWSGRGCRYTGEPALLAVANLLQPMVVAGIAGRTSLPDGNLWFSGEKAGGVVRAPPWLSTAHLAVTFAAGYYWAFDHLGLLSRIAPNGIGTEQYQLNADDLSAGLTEDSPNPVLYAGRGSATLAAGRQLFRVIRGRSAVTRLDMQDVVTGLSGARDHVRERLLVTLDRGAVLLSPSGEACRQLTVETQTIAPVGTILGDGRIMLWSETGHNVYEMRLYAATGQHVEMQASQELSLSSPGSPLKLVRTNSLAQCAVIPSTPDTPIRIWEADPRTSAR